MRLNRFEFNSLVIEIYLEFKRLAYRWGLEDG